MNSKCTTLFVLTCLSLLVFSLSSFKGWNSDVIDVKDLADTASLRKTFLPVDATRYITYKGIVKGKKWICLYRLTHPQGHHHCGCTVHFPMYRPLSGISVETTDGKCKTKTDAQGRFSLKVPKHSSDALLISEYNGHSGDSRYITTSWYSDVEIAVKDINPKKELRIKLKDRYPVHWNPRF